jgi:replicative DNA helicase
MSLVPLDTLTKYGQTFQTKCVVSLLTDRPFVEQAMDVVLPTFFESDANQWIVERILWYFTHYRALPTVEVLKRESDKIEKNDVLKVAVVEHLKTVFHVTKALPDDLKYIKDELLTFCKNQAIKTAVLKSADLLQKGSYDQIKVLIDQAMRAGQERNVGHVWAEEFEMRISKAARNVIATPWDCINQITDGGLGAGELATVIAPSGIGKSWILAAIGAAAMRQGKTVAHYTFELSESYLGLRYDSIFTSIAPNLIKDHGDLVKLKIAGITGNLFIKYFPTGTITINAINAHFQQLSNMGKRPDMIIVDYADLMRSARKADARHEELGFIHEEIRGFLGEQKIPGWTASQSQRSAAQDDVVEADKIAGAYSKIMANDLVFSASRKIADKMTNTARVHMIKNRFGPDGITFPAEMDLEHGIVNIYDENSPQGVVVKAKMNSGDGALKAMLSKKLIDTQKVVAPTP